MNPIGNSIPEALSPLMLEASNTIARQAEEIATLAQQIATFTEQYASLTVQNANAQEQIIELKTKLAAPTRKEELLTAYILGQVPDDNRDAVQNRLNKWLAKQLGE